MHWHAASVEIIANRPNPVPRLFEKTGTTMTAKGSEDECITLEGPTALHTHMQELNNSVYSYETKLAMELRFNKFNSLSIAETRFRGLGWTIFFIICGPISCKEICTAILHRS